MSRSVRKGQCSSFILTFVLISKTNFNIPFLSNFDYNFSKGVPVGGLYFISFTKKYHVKRSYLKRRYRFDVGRSAQGMSEWCRLVTSVPPLVSPHNRGSPGYNYLSRNFKPQDGIGHMDLGCLSSISLPEIIREQGYFDLLFTYLLRGRSPFDNATFYNSQIYLILRRDFSPLHISKF